MVSYGFYVQNISSIQSLPSIFAKSIILDPISATTKSK
jgi:hypothetical protein